MKQVKRTYRAWCKSKNVDILDPDGFDRMDEDLQSKFFTEEEFEKGLMRSTISGEDCKYPGTNSNAFAVMRNTFGDTRDCDYTKVTKQQLKSASQAHITEVRRGARFISDLLFRQCIEHDHTKLENLDLFFRDFTSGFAQREWYNLHTKTERHHPKSFKHPDINLVDILEMMIDCCVAGVSRKGNFNKEEPDLELLKDAFNNTINLILDNIILVEEKENEDK